MNEPINEAGALLLWQQEISRGERKTTTFDALWHAACLEARAREEVRDGLIVGANEDRVQAAGLMLGYFAQRSAA